MIDIFILVLLVLLNVIAVFACFLLLTRKSIPTGKISKKFAKIFKFLGAKSFDDETGEEEIRMMLDACEEAGSIDEAEREMIHNIFEFDDKTVGDIATHRKDIAALPIDAKNDEIIDMLINEGYSRIPVYEDNIDNIVGILHVRDIFRFMLTNEGQFNKNINVNEILREAYFVPISKKTDDLFREMKKNKVHMAVIVDEYGGCAGLVTMEDLIEEVMGNIFDEYDDEEKPEIEVIDKTTYSIDGQASLDTIAEFFGISLPISDYDTVGGFIIEQIGRIPSDGEQPEIEFEGLVFKVCSIVEKRINSILVFGTPTTKKEAFER